jgi:putative hemolysin
MSPTLPDILPSLPQALAPVLNAVGGGADEAVTPGGGFSPWHFAVFGALLLMSALFSGAESALTVVSPLKVKALAEEGHRTGKLVAALTRDKSRLISVLLVANNIVNAALTTYATVVFAEVFASSMSPALAATLAAITSVVFLLLLGEVIPKTIGVNMPLAVSKLVAWPAYCVQVLFTPVTWLLSGAQRLALAILRHDAEAHERVSGADIEAMAHIAEKQDVLGEGSGQTIANIVSLHETFVREVLTPRIEVVGVRADTSYADVIRCFRTHRYSRLPVYLGDIDDVIGVITVRDVLGLSEEEQKGFSLADIARTPMFVPEMKRVDELIIEMRRERNHFAVVVDEYGGTAGVVTLEDLLEAVVGQIEDEHDAGGAGIRRIGPTLLLVDGGVSLSELEHALRFKLKAAEDVDTVAGLFLRESEKIPQEGDSVTFDTIELVVRRMRGQRIARLLVQIRVPATPRTGVAG